MGSNPLNPVPLGLKPKNSHLVAQQLQRSNPPTVEFWAINNSLILSNPYSTEITFKDKYTLSGAPQP